MAVSHTVGLVFWALPRLVVYQGHMHLMVTENVTNSGSNGELFVSFFFF